MVYGVDYNSFVYIWFDKFYDKYYIGSHMGDVNDGYLFGGLDIKKAYNDRPLDFHRKIVSYHNVMDSKKIRKIEEVYLKFFDVENSDIFYNRTNSSYGGEHRPSIEKRLKDIDINGLNSFQRAAIKMSETRKNDNSYATAKIKEYDTKKSNKKSYNNTKKKISESLLGSKWVNKNGTMLYIKNSDYITYLLDGWKDGISDCISYTECSNLAIENSIKSANQWYIFSKNLNRVPYHPNRKYKKEWVSWSYFLRK